MKLSDQLRKAVERSDRSRYSLCKEAGLDQAALSRFVSGQAGLGLDSIDRLAAVLGLRLVVHKQPRKRR